MQRTPRSTRRLSEDEEETQLGNVLRRTGARTSCGVMPRTTTPSTATRRSSSCTCRNRDACQPGRDASTDQWGGDQAQRALTRPLSFAAPPGWRSTNFRMEYLFGFSIAPMPATSAITTAPGTPYEKAVVPARKRKTRPPFPREAEEDWQGETARERNRRHAGTDTCGVPGDTFGLSTPCVVLKVPLIAARVGFARPGSEFRSTSFRRSPPRSHDHALSKPIRDAE